VGEGTAVALSDSDIDGDSITSALTDPDGVIDSLAVADADGVAVATCDTDGVSEQEALGHCDCDVAGVDASVGVVSDGNSLGETEAAEEMVSEGVGVPVTGGVDVGVIVAVADSDAGVDIEAVSE
jgi:hypothetical protein